MFAKLTRFIRRKTGSEADTPTAEYVLESQIQADIDEAREHYGTAGDVPVALWATDDGFVITRWRTDESGRQWYKRTKASSSSSTRSGTTAAADNGTIRAIPSDAPATAAERSGLIHGSPDGHAEFDRE